jgi:hypothetical protein
VGGWDRVASIPPPTSHKPYYVDCIRSTLCKEDFVFVYYFLHAMTFRLTAMGIGDAAMQLNCAFSLPVTYSIAMRNSDFTT